MKIVYLGQAGLLFDTNGMRILVDPYLSDSVAENEPSKHRRTPVDGRFLDLRPDIVICTHAHGDHCDLQTLEHYFTFSSEILLLAPRNAWEIVRDFGGERNNYVLFDAGTQWTEKDVLFRAVTAKHSDPSAIGVIISAEGKNYYITGDTLYSEKVFEDLPEMEFDALFLPVNGRGNNMNFPDAERFAARIDAKFTVPLHVGLLDDQTAERFICKNKIIPEIYREIKF